jgi:hypothetical protein
MDRFCHPPLPGPRRTFPTDEVCERCGGHLGWWAGADAALARAQAAEASTPDPPVQWRDSWQGWWLRHRVELLGFPLGAAAFWLGSWLGRLL